MSDDWRALDEQVLIDKDTYHFAIEEFQRGEDRMLFVHLRVRKWSLSVFKEILRNWRLFRECVTCPVYAVGGVDDTTKWERFVTRLGFRYLTDVVCENGATRRLMLHTKNNNKAVNELQILTDAEPVGND